MPFTNIRRTNAQSFILGFDPVAFSLDRLPYAGTASCILAGFFCLLLFGRRRSSEPSAHSARIGEPALVDYTSAIGPYRATPTKKDAAAEIGLSGLTDIVSRAPCPSVAIGGIKAPTSATSSGDRRRRRRLRHLRFRRRPPPSRHLSTPCRPDLSPRPPILETCSDDCEKRALFQSVPPAPCAFLTVGRSSPKIRSPLPKRCPRRPCPKCWRRGGDGRWSAGNRDAATRNTKRLRGGMRKEFSPESQAFLAAPPARGSRQCVRDNVVSPRKPRADRHSRSCRPDERNAHRPPRHRGCKDQPSLAASPSSHRLEPCGLPADHSQAPDVERYLPTASVVGAFLSEKPSEGRRLPPPSPLKQELRCSCPNAAGLSPRPAHPAVLFTASLVAGITMRGIGTPASAGKAPGSPTTPRPSTPSLIRFTVIFLSARQCLTSARSPRSPSTRRPPPQSTPHHGFCA